jgi:LmbE family N-acetylglucosaminyl deacetylase
VTALQPKKRERLSIGDVFRAVTRFIYRRLLHQDAQNSLRVWTMLDVPNSPPQLVESFDEERVMVLAPHMDDEVVGCGGTLRRHVLSGARITVVFLTDGRDSDPQIAKRCRSEAELREATAALCVRRKQEAELAARVIGYEDLVFLDRPDGALKVDEALVREVTHLINERAPQVIYYPCALENHPDHWAASLLLGRVIDAGQAPVLATTLCRAYEAWTPLPPNRLVEISDVFDIKLEALQSFTSQLEYVDYVRTTTGLNAYRAMTQDGNGYWEAFYEGTAAQHAELVRSLGFKR